jgi:Tol biopolymer transport system component
MIRSAHARRLIVVILTLAFCFPLTALSQDDKPEGKMTDKLEFGLPLRATDKIEFTTDEGTWMSLDVSPDGQTIVFDLLGDIYTLPVAGGEARRIIGGIAFDSQPKFSPDGKKIVFLSDRSGAENVWVCDPDGSNPKVITRGRNQSYNSPAWTADGQYILVSKSGEAVGTPAIWIYNKDGGAGMQVGPPDPPLPQPGSNEPPRPRLSRMGAVASPDGRYFYYAARTGAFNYNATFPIWQIVRFDRDTSEMATITNAQGSAMRPLLSPDGKKLVYATRYETGTALRMRDLETGEERWLVNQVTRDDQESRATRDTMPGYAFMPDGKSLIVPIDGKIKRVDAESGACSTIPFTARVEAEVAPRIYTTYRVDDSATVRARLIRWPALSPDGSRVVFSSLNKLWIMDLPSGTPKRLTSSSVGEFMPSWSPDGRYLAYVTWSAGGGQINRVAADGSSAPEQLSRRAAYYSYPTYSPDGTKIVYLSGATSDQLYADLREQEPDVPYEIDLHKADGGEITGIGGSMGLDLRWIPAGGGNSTLIGSAST